MFSNECGVFVLFIMITVYVIESVTDATWYTGMAMDAASRLKDHNAGKNRFTKGHLPWKIIFCEELGKDSGILLQYSQVCFF